MPASWSDNEKLARMLDGLDEWPCAFCKNPAPVPEYVMGAAIIEGELALFVVCEECSDALDVAVNFLRLAGRLVAENN